MTHFGSNVTATRMMSSAKMMVKSMNAKTLDSVKDVKLQRSIQWMKSAVN